MKKKLVSMMAAGALALALAAPGYAARTYTPAWLERDATLEGAQNAGTPLTAVNKGGKWGYVDWRGRMVVAAEYEYALEYSEGLAAVGKDGRSGYIDGSGKVAIADRKSVV